MKILGTTITRKDDRTTLKKSDLVPGTSATRLNILMRWVAHNSSIPLVHMPASLRRGHVAKH